MVYAQRPERPALLADDVPGLGRWVFVFSILARLAAHAGECEDRVTTGADLLDLVPEGIGMLLDGEDDHWLPVLLRRGSEPPIARA